MEVSATETKQFCQDLEMYAMDVTENNPCPECNTESEDPRCPRQVKLQGLNTIAARAFEISKQRGQNPDDVFKHMAGEVIEAQQARQIYLTHLWNPISLEKLENEYADELADVIICALSAAARSELDIEAALARKMKCNEQRAKEGK